MFSEKKVAVLKIRALIIDAARCWLNRNGYIEVQGPVILPAIGDFSGSFEVKYFDKKAYLTQGLQPYANAFVANLGKVFTVAPVFRAEKTKTHRHLAEYWRIQVAQKGDFKDVQKAQEQLLTFICHALSNAKDTHNLLSRSHDLSKVNIPFTTLTYDDTIEILQRDGFNVYWGQNLDWKMEKHISKRFSQPFFITKFPISSETYFHKSDPESEELSLSADLLAPKGYGEIGSSGQIITEKKAISKKMNEQNIIAADKHWYLSFMEDDCNSQSGFAIGLERLTQWICGLDDIKETIAFPRVYSEDLL